MMKPMSLGSILEAQAAKRTGDQLPRVLMKQLSNMKSVNP